MADVCNKRFYFLFLISMLLMSSMNAISPVSTITQSDFNQLKGYADSFNQSRNYPTRSGPAEQVCWTQGTFLAYHPCNDYSSCLETANLVCSVNGAQGCAIDLLATDILDYKNGVDRLNAAYSKFMEGYSSFGTASLENSLNVMDASFDDMRAAADEVSQSKLRFPDQIPCPCGGNPSACCLGICPEAHFNYSALSLGKAEISALRLKKCTDGTLGGECSLSLPKECITGQLIDNAQQCGCPSHMAVSSNGKTCEFAPCNDNGAIFQSGTCSPSMEKKCVEGVLVSKASECGCPANKIRENENCIFICTDGTREGECSPNHPLQCINGVLSENTAQCGCPILTSQTCSKANVTKYHDVTYIFDRGYNRTVNAPYTFEKVTCHLVQSIYVGLNCAQLNGTIVNSTPIYPPEPVQQTIRYVGCNRCPAICTRNAPNGLACGYCICPPNLGFCESEGLREQANNTPAYCQNELWLPQKSDIEACKNGFECKTNICQDGVCYNPDFLQSILNWFRRLLGVRA